MLPGRWPITESALLADDKFDAFPKRPTFSGLMRGDDLKSLTLLILRK